MLLFLLACASPPPPCPEAPPADRVLSADEAALVSPYLTELRAGIQLFGEQGFGLCQGKLTCDQWLGPTPDLLGEGDFLIRAELSVPTLGETWQVRFKIDCTLTDASGRQTTQTHQRDYPVRATGKDKGYKLQPLWRVQSPHANGERECAFSLTPIRPDGKEGQPWTGTYHTPPPS